MFAEVNHLPKDDPLRAPPVKAQATAADADEARAYLQNASMNRRRRLRSWSGRQLIRRQPMPMQMKHYRPRGKAIPAAKLQPSSAESTAAVTLGSGAPVTMPGFVGKSMRDVVATAADLGLERPRLRQRCGFRASSGCGYKGSCRHDRCSSVSSIIHSQSKF